MDTVEVDIKEKSLSMYGFINYIINLIVDDPTWVERAKNPALLLIHTILHPLHASDPLN